MKKKYLIWIVVSGTIISMLTWGIIAFLAYSGFFSSGMTPWVGVSINIVFILIGVLILWVHKNTYFDQMEIIVKGIFEVSQGNYHVKLDIKTDDALYETAKQLMDIEKNLMEYADKYIQNERLKVELLTNVSHDLRTPLTSVIGNLELLKEENLPEETRRKVEVISEKTSYLNQMLNTVFELSKAASGALLLECMEFDAVQMIKQTLAEVGEIAEYSKMELQQEFCVEEFLLYNDNNRLQRALQNVLINAYQYALSGTRIFVSVKSDEEKLIISILNTAAYRMDFTPDEIVSRFVRGEKSRNGSGSGLGLAIAKTFTEACGGEFEVKIRGDQFEVIFTLVSKDTKE